MKQDNKYQIKIDILTGLKTFKSWLRIMKIKQNLHSQSRHLLWFSQNKKNGIYPTVYALH